jgi:HPr kinase/phosphorylase
MKEITVKQLYEEMQNVLSLKLVCGNQNLDYKINDPNIHRPGLALAGYYQRFPNHRIQLIGETELSYMQTLPDDILFDRLRELMMRGVPCFIVAKALSVPHQMTYIATDLNIPIFVSKLPTIQLFWQLSRYLRDSFNPSLTMHSTMVDVYGVGLLLTGKSGIGKSECALELVERGHRLIADDIVLVKSDEKHLIGTSAKDFGYFMEVRGVGVINIERMFGVQAIRKEKRIDMQVELMLWHENMDYERIGMGEKTTDVLGLKLPLVNIPVSPGKNVAVIVEVVAMNFILKSYGGYNAGIDFQKKLMDEINNKQAKKNKK